jgi:hypothetical protein
MDAEVTSGNMNALCGIIDAAHEFADSEYQERVWVRNEGPEWSSYDEASSLTVDKSKTSYTVARCVMVFRKAHNALWIFLSKLCTNSIEACPRT